MAEGGSLGTPARTGPGGRRSCGHCSPYRPERLKPAHSARIPAAGSLTDGSCDRRQASGAATRGHGDPGGGLCTAMVSHGMCFP